MSIKINDKNLSKMYIGTPITDATKIQMSSADSKTVASAINENKENISTLNQSLNVETADRTNGDNVLRARIDEEQQIRNQGDTSLQTQITTNKKAENVNISENTRTLYGLTVDNANVDKALQDIKNIQNIQKDLTIFTSSGTYTVLAGVNFIDVFLCGGGGGGAGGSYGCAGGGGGGGECYIFSKLPVSAGQTYSIIVGAGGSNGNAGGIGTFSSYVVSDGGTGGTSQFGSFIALGGKGGTKNGIGGDGNGGGGSFAGSKNGSAGGNPITFSEGVENEGRLGGKNTQKDIPSFYGRIFGAGGGGGGSYGGYGTTIIYTGGVGGNSNAGAGGNGKQYGQNNATSGIAGIPNTGGGGGGGGGISNDISNCLGGYGGAGGSGIVVIKSY